MEIENKNDGKAFQKFYTLWTADITNLECIIRKENLINYLYQCVCTSFMKHFLFMFLKCCNFLIYYNNTIN